MLLNSYLKLYARIIMYGKSLLGYYIVTVGNVNEVPIRNYIKNRRAAISLTTVNKE